MSINWVYDIAEMHRKYGVNEVVDTFDKEKLRSFLEFRINFLQEELDELKSAKSADDVVDALIDLCVVAIGTLDAYRVNSYVAWDQVHKANMNKEVGIKESRPNPLGLPDLVKPDGWEAPEHFQNVGMLDKVFSQDETSIAAQEDTPVENSELPEEEVVVKPTLKKTRAKKAE